MSFATAHADHLDPDRYALPEVCEVCERPVSDCACRECPKCGEQGNPDCYGGPCSGVSDTKPGELSAEQEKEHSELAERIVNLEQKVADWRKAEPAHTPDSFFADMPEGDFEYDDRGEADWNTYYDSDREAYVLTCPGIVIGRKNGKRYLETHSCDCDGDWDFDYAWDEREVGCATPEAWAAVQDGLHSDAHFQGWANYYHYIARTGDDNLGQITREVEPENWFRFCMDASLDMLRYLVMNTPYEFAKDED